MCAHVTDDDQTEAAPLSPAVARSGPIWLAGFVALVICTQVANGTWAAWTKPGEEHPVALLLMSSRNRYLIATVASGISPWTWALVGTLRIAEVAHQDYTGQIIYLRRDDALRDDRDARG